jgi:hypothetical protein
MRLLRKHRPALKLEPVEIQQALAYLVWVSPARSRQHKEREGYMSISYQELDQRFGRGRFSSLNEHLGIFSVTANWSHAQALTRGYKLAQDLEEAVSTWLSGWRRRMRKVNRILVGLDGRKLHQIPQAVAAKDSKGITAKTWGRAAVKRFVPVDVPRLSRYCGKLKRMVDDPQADLFIGGDAADYQYRPDVVGRMMGMAHYRDGQWSIIQRYIESDSGRLYGKNINLQTVPKSVKEVALHGLWEYDFANCHYAILYQLAVQYGLDLPAVFHYLQNKQQVRRQLMADLGLSEGEVKTCVIALIYGARFLHRHEDAIPAAIGQDAALRLYRHPLFIAIKAEVGKAARGIIEKWPRSRKRLKNAYGKWISEKKDWAQILAHLLQGIEARMLETVRKLYPDEILLLQHDGFASAVQLDTAKMMKAIHEGTGYLMQIEEQQIHLSPDLGID